MLKFMLSLLLMVSLVFPCAAHAGRTKADDSLYDQIVTLARERQALLMQIMDELKLAQNGGSMMKTTFYGSPMVWTVDISGRDSVTDLSFWLNSSSGESRSYFQLGNSVLWEAGGEGKRLEINYCNLDRLIAECYPTFFGNERIKLYVEVESKKHHEFQSRNRELEYYDQYIKKAVLPDKQKEALDYFWSKLQGLKDLDKEFNAAFSQEFNALFPQYIFSTLDYMTITHWPAIEEWQDMQSKMNHNFAMASREWNKKYMGKRDEAKIVDELRSFAIPENLSFGVGSFKFKVDAQLAGNERIAGVERFAALMQGLVDGGKAIHTVDGDFDVYTDAQSENGLKGRVLLDRAKGIGYWEPAMYGEMDRIIPVGEEILDKTIALYSKLCLYVGQVLREAVAVGTQSGDGTVDAL